MVNSTVSNIISLSDSLVTFYGQVFTRFIFHPSSDYATLNFLI